MVIDGNVKTSEHPGSKEIIYETITLVTVVMYDLQTRSRFQNYLHYQVKLSFTRGRGKGKGACSIPSAIMKGSRSRIYYLFCVSYFSFSSTLGNFTYCSLLFIFVFGYIFVEEKDTLQEFNLFCYVQTSFSESQHIFVVFYHLSMHFVSTIFLLR